MKQLTIAIPAYNAEAYLRKCLESMTGLDERLEVIVINDGSTDATAAIAQEFVNHYPNDVRLLSKPNGGHGSGINLAIQHAAGCYFKVVDADDWIISENLKFLLDALEQTQVDAVITGYKTVNMKSGKIFEYPSQCKYDKQEIGLEQLLEVYEDIASCCSFHGLCYRTQMYRGCGLKLSEGIFYEDQEYATLPFAYVDKVLILPFCLYMYLIGNANQSIAFHNQVKRIGHIETVTHRILEFKKRNSQMTSAREEYFLRKLMVIAVSYFAVALVKNPDKKEGMKNAERYRTFLENEEPELLRRINKKYWTLLLFRRMHLSASIYQMMLDTNLYKKFRKIWLN